MSVLFWLTDEQWAAIEAHLPRNQPGAARVDDRRVISGILHVLKVGCRWCGHGRSIEVVDDEVVDATDVTPGCDPVVGIEGGA
jgi:hypothetical protein